MASTYDIFGASEEDIAELVQEGQYGKKYARSMLNRDQAYDVWQYQYWERYLKTLALSCFKWEGLPSSIPSRAIEWILLHFGAGAFFSEDGGMLFAQMAPSDNWNMYYDPNRIMLTAPNGKIWERHCHGWIDDDNRWHDRDAAMIYDNELRVPLLSMIQGYARRIAEYDRIIDVNVKAQLTPFIVYGNETSKGTRKKAIKRLDTNAQYIELNSDLPANETMIGVLNTAAPVVFQQIQAEKRELINEAITAIGIDNNPQAEKRERVNTHEAISNNEQIYISRNSRLKARKDACVLLNEIFGIEADVTYCVPHVFDTSMMEGGAEDDLYDGESDLA